MLMYRKNGILFEQAPASCIVMPPPLSERPLGLTDCERACVCRSQRRVVPKCPEELGYAINGIHLVSKTSNMAAQSALKAPTLMAEVTTLALVDDEQFISRASHTSQLFWIAGGKCAVGEPREKPGQMHGDALARVYKTLQRSRNL